MANAMPQLERLLYLIPAANQKGGVDLTEMAQTLGISKKQVFRDLHLVNARVSYLPNELGSQLQFHIEGDRFEVWSAGPFKRPNRVTRLEALALAVALRMRRRDRASEAEAEAESLVHGLVSQLAGPEPEGDSEAAAADPLVLNPVQDQSLQLGSESDRAAVLKAAESRCACTITYLSSGSAYPSTRTIRPYAVIPAEGYAYAVAHCSREDALRVFRLDRVLGAEVLHDAEFEVPDDFTPEAYMRDGRVYLAAMEQTARVRYSRVVARWVAERTGEPGEVQPDGSLIVEHTVSDPDWLVRHVLQYAGEAEVLEPPSLRQRVLQAAEGI